MRAQHNIGVCYYEGLGLEQSYEEAVKWFTLAADEGYPDSEYYLGVCYNNGQGVEKSRSTAVKLLRRAKKGGNEEASEALKILSE